METSDNPTIQANRLIRTLRREAILREGFYPQISWAMLDVLLQEINRLRDLAGEGDAENEYYG